MEQTNAPLLDLDHLAQYTLGDPALTREVLGIFAAQLQVYLGQMNQAQSEKEWREAAHALKGSARMVGAFQLGEAALAAEKMPDAPFGSQREARLGGLSDAAARTSAALGEKMDQGQPEN